MSTTPYQIGDVVTLRSRDVKPHGIHYVYALVDDDTNAFYVGVSVSPRERLKCHCSSWGNNHDVIDICQRLKEARLVILAAKPKRWQAHAMERRLIARHPHLVNVAWRRTTQAGQVLIDLGKNPQ